MKVPRIADGKQGANEDKAKLCGLVQNNTVRYYVTITHSLNNS